MHRHASSFAVLVLALLIAVPAAFAADNYYEGWDVPLDPAGWVPNTADASIAVVNPGGNPGGYVRSTRNSGGTFPIGATTELPVASGDYAAAGVFEVSFDVLFEQGAFTGLAFRARFQGSGFNGWHYPIAADFTPGVWRSYVVTFDPTWSDVEAMAAGWVSDGDPVTFAQTFGDVYHPEVRIDGTGEPLVAGIDNFRIRACPENSTVLDADFAADTPGLPPDPSLPGPPLGDFLVVQEASGTVTVESAVGSLTDQPILMDQVPGIGALDVFCYPAPHGCGLVRVAWSSLARSNDIFFLACVIRDGSGLIAASVEYRPNGELTYNSAGILGPTLPVTYTPDVDQRFEILVDSATHTSSLSVDGVPVAGFQSVPFPQAATGVGRLGFEAGGTDAQQFAIDDVSMTACDCGCDMDTVAPVVEITLDPDTLWPPNHKMVEVCATVASFDACDTDPVVTLQSVTSDEPDNGTGDGNTINDIQDADIGTGDLCFLLRSERKGNGDGRTYTVTYCVTDDAGNETCGSATVEVPHDQSGAALASLGFSADGTALLPGVEEYALVVRSTDSFDVADVDLDEVLVRGAHGFTAPIRVEQSDVDQDGRDDLRIFFSARKTLPGAEGGSTDPFAFRYETIDGTGYLVPDIFSLGATIESVTGIVEGAELPAGVMFARPNPFTSSTRIRYAVGARESAVDLAIYDVSGRRVCSLVQGMAGPGTHDVVWDGRDDQGVRTGNGVYFLRAVIDGRRTFQRLVLVR